MKQILHIFRKDIRHHWPEILTVLVLQAGYVWRAPKQWSVLLEARGIDRFLNISADILLPVAWCFLIVRVIQSEPLVGNRQFWITRPYEWPKLLVAKIVFIFAFVNIPLLISQAILLRVAAFSFLHNLPGLLGMHIGLSCLLLLCVGTLGTITRNLGQAALVALVVLAALAGTAYLSSLLPKGDIAALTGKFEMLEEVLMFGAAGTAALWQFARRHTSGPRYLVLVAGCVVVLILAVLPTNSMIESAYPRRIPATVPNLQVSLIPVEAPAPNGLEFRAPQTEMMVRFPVRFSGIEPNQVVEIEGKKISIDGPNGFHWDLGWQNSWTKLWPDDSSSYVNFEIKPELFKKVQKTHVTVHISLLLATFKQSRLHKISLSEGPFPIEGIGLCRIAGFTEGEIDCRAPLSSPIFVANIATPTSYCSEEPQSTSGSSSTDGARHAFSWHETDTLPDVGIDPIDSFNIYFEDFFIEARPANKKNPLRLCPGDQIELGTPVLVDRTSIQLTTPPVKLEDYELGLRYSLQ